MDFFGFLKGIFTPSNNRNHHQNDDTRSQFLRTDDRDDDDPLRFGNFESEFFSEEDPVGFRVFSNPLEMHRYFEKQMHDMLKTFGFQQDDAFFGFGEGNPSRSPFGPMLEDSEQQTDDRQGNLRDQFLKPGYEEPHKDVTQRSDSDLDGRIQPNDLDSMFKEKNSITPYKPQKVTPYMRSFGQSMTSKTIRNSDGSIEKHRTVKDSQGNQETIVTKKWGDKEYSVTTRTDKEGKQVVTENLTNLDENDLKLFLNKQMEPEAPVAPKNPHNWFPFDKYFR